MGDVRHLHASKECRPQLLGLLLTYRFVMASLATSVLCATVAHAEEREKLAAVIELGAELESQIVDGEFSAGPYVALEIEAVKDSLEIEIGRLTAIPQSSDRFGERVHLEGAHFSKRQTGDHVWGWTAMGIPRGGR